MDQPAMMEDAELLRRYAETRSEEAFAELVRRRIGLVYSVALRTTRNPHRAEDATQAVFADLARKAAALSDRPVLAGWLYRSAHYAALGIVRAEQHRAAREQEAHFMQTILGAENTAAEWEKVRPVLDAAMSELSESDRDAIALRFFDNRPFAEIGARLKLTENSARMRVERALDKLHALLMRRGIRSSTAALGAVLAHEALGAAPPSLAASVTGSALASAKLAAPSLTFFQLMGTSKIATGGVTSLLLLTLGTTGYEVYAARRTEATMIAAQQTVGVLSAKVRDAEDRAINAERAAAESQRALDTARAAVKPPPATPPRRSQADLMADGEAFAARHPEVKKLFIEATRAELGGTYAPLFRSLHLTPAQIEQLKDLIIAGGRFVGVDGQTVAFNISGNPTQTNEQLRALLGEDGFRQLKEFGERVNPAWQTTVELAAELYRTATPLTAAQAESVLTVLVDGRQTVDWSARLQFDWDAIMTKARGVLSEEQLAALERLRAQDDFSQALARSRRARAGKQ